MFQKIMLILVIISSYGFKWGPCKKDMERNRIPFGYGTQFSTSTSQFASSSGACAMLGKADHDSKVYVLHNIEKMKIDFARGYGEYAMAFASIYGCNNRAQIAFSGIIKNKFSVLEENNTDKALERNYEMLVNEIKTNPVMAQSCSFGI